MFANLIPVISSPAKKIRELADLDFHDRPHVMHGEISRVLIFKENVNIFDIYGKIYTYKSPTKSDPNRKISVEYSEFTNVWISILEPMSRHLPDGHVEFRYVSSTLASILQYVRGLTTSPNGSRLNHVDKDPDYQWLVEQSQEVLKCLSLFIS